MPTKLFSRIQKIASPEDVMGELFERVQRERLFPDSKTVVDLIPIRRVRRIKQEYELERKDPNFNLREFVNRHFYEFGEHKSNYRTNASLSPQQHIEELWPVLTRRIKKSRGSLIALPHDYIVPGGRFNEQFYWDSYFIMLGLAAGGHWAMVENMVENSAYLLKKLGFVPTGNRTYFMSRSQPPFFSRMVKLLAEKQGEWAYVRYLPAMVTEYRFWMRGAKDLNESDRMKLRTVLLPSGDILNRYYDNKRETPRPESRFEDVVTVDRGNTDPRVFLHLRATAESGWDFSSRWMDDTNDLASTRTADIVPVDLNCLLYDLEMTIADAYEMIRQKGLSERFRDDARKRVSIIQRYHYHWNDGFYYDYDNANSRQTQRKSLAGIFPLWSGIAEPEQAERVVQMIKDQFLAPGGLLTTTVETGQQWDAPNGWAPLQYVAIEGLRRYGFHDLANEIKDRWIRTILAVYDRTGKMVEKYNVMDQGELGGGGEYPLQDGFGWTNGVLYKLMSE